MISYLKYFLVILFSFTMGLLGVGLVKGFGKKAKAGQPILKYVDQHKAKAGTPTMGGLGFILPSCVIALVFNVGIPSGSIAAFATIAYCILGFFDDFLKIKRHDNGGLTPMQKIVGQVGIACVLAYYCFKNPHIYTVRFPFTDYTANLGWGIIPFAIIVFIAVTNAVNLTDGLDGLAGTTSLVYLCCFVIILFAMCVKELIDDSLLVFCLALVGGLMAFLCYNSKPASIFMGDTGSLALGGGVCAVAMFSGNPFIIPIIGIMFVASCISVIIQVLVFKLTKKRVFKMAPLHHHFEKCGYSETKIVTIYGCVTAIFGLVGVLAVISFI